MFDFPLSLQGVYSSIFLVAFHRQKKAQKAWKIAQTCLCHLRVIPTMDVPNKYACDVEILNSINNTM